MHPAADTLVEHVRGVMEEAVGPEEVGRGWLVGVSGGMDSVVLLHVLVRLGLDVQAAHVNYQLRGTASAEDAAWVQAFCRQLQVPLHITTVQEGRLAETPGLSLQAAARTLRYDFFGEVAQREDLAFVAVAHHQDDQAETLLLNLVRGAGPEGLAGMPLRRLLAPACSILLVRPLLQVSRATLDAYARAAGLGWREDASNASLTYRRGQVRHRVLPLLREHFGASVAERLAASAARLRAYVDDPFLRQLAAHWESLAEETPLGGRLSLDGLEALTLVWRGRVLLEGLHRWLPEAPRRARVAATLARLLEAQPGRRVTLTGGTVWRERAHLSFVAASAIPAPPAPTRLHPGTSVAWAGGRLSLEMEVDRPAELAAGALAAVLVDADTIQAPLTVRRWQPGDRLQPLGMTGTKKVSDLLTDARVPPHQRPQVGVLLSEGRIIWVIGVRLAHAVRVRPETRQIAKIAFIPGV